MTRFQAQRMIWIDAWLTRSPDILLNRRHLEQAFDLSTVQASKDIARFQNLWAHRMTYNRNAKGFHAADGTAPVFAQWMHEAVFSAGRAAAEVCQA
jgi:hypothetical protein